MKIVIKEYTLAELAEETGRNYNWLKTKIDVISANVGCRKIGRSWIFPESAVKFVNETWEKRNMDK
jgi:hypothetical protein